MYLARRRIKGKLHYSIRQSICKGREIVSRELLDLGRDPEKFIIYPDDGNAFYIDPEICDRIEACGASPDNDELERVFWPFLRPETRRVIEMFTRPSPGRGQSLMEQKKRCETQAFHTFDKRRMHYLRYGELDQSNIGAVPKKIYRKLLDKSRDEIEQQFLEMEHVLENAEKKNYVFAIFNIAGHFNSEIARKFPQALSQKKVDESFMEELCRLNADAAFWADLGVSERLHDYLVRYACWFYDSEFEGGRYLEDLMWQFKRRHHGFAPPRPQTMPIDEAVSIMGISEQALSGMTVRTLTRQYRVMAHQYHPDTGGDHDQFIRLNRAYENLLRKIKGKDGRPGYTTRRG